MDFIFPSLMLGMGLLALPILIHLINLLRHQKVAWAAMEFLRISQKKNSTWIRIRELLLLLLRIAAIAAVVLLAAGPMLKDRWAAMLGDSRTHHIILWDDSYSNTDRFADSSAFEVGKQAIGRIAEQLVARTDRQLVTLLRFSQAGRPGRGTQPDLMQESVGSTFLPRIQGVIGPLTASESDVGPATALAAIDQLLGEGQGESRVVTIVSDLRKREWGEPKEIEQQLRRLTAASVPVRLVHTVDVARPNRALARLAPVAGTRAVGVPFAVELGVTNYSADVARNVSVTVLEDGAARPAAVTLEEIAPGQTGTARFSVSFSTAGPHRLEARLEGDNVVADNRRYAVIDLPLVVPVLIIDGSDAAIGGRLLARALSPGKAVRTGIRPQIEPPHFLNSQTARSLSKFKSLFLSDVSRLDPPAIEALEGYVKEGGGVAFFLGGSVTAEFYNSALHRDGEGLFPAPLGPRVEMPPDLTESTPDIVVADHPIFRVFGGERNSFLGLVKIAEYQTTPSAWRPAEDSGTQLIARLRNGAPFAIEKSYGQGRVVALLTSAAPSWNNWARNPSFVVGMLDLQSYLGSAKEDAAGLVVDVPLEMKIDPSEHQPRVGLLPAGAGPGELLALDAAPDGTGLKLAFSETSKAGFYELQLARASGDEREIRVIPYNVAPEEGDLSTVTGTQLASSLPGIRFEYLPASAIHSAKIEDKPHLRDAIMWVLILVLLGEQALAYVASYHPPKGAAR